MSNEQDSSPEPGWPLNDYFAAAWLGAIGIVVLLGVAVGGWLIVSGRIGFNVTIAGSINLGSIINGTLIPLFWVITAVAIIELFGKKKVRSLLEQWGGGGRR